MTKDEMQIAVAEACGWTAKETYGAGGVWIAFSPSGQRAVYIGNSPEHAILNNCPNYPDDLNAMHEAEKVLCANSSLASDYSIYLREAVGLRALVPHASPSCLDEFYFAHVTALQRCEAFLRTIGKWKE